MTRREPRRRIEDMAQIEKNRDRGGAPRARGEVALDRLTLIRRMKGSADVMIASTIRVTLPAHQAVCRRELPLKNGSSFTGSPVSFQYSCLPALAATARRW